MENSIQDHDALVAIAAEDIHAQQGEPTTTSLLVAKRFNKQHKDVLRAIRNLECSEEFRQRNFAPSKYTSEQGKMLPMYRMTKNGFRFLQWV